MSSLPGPSLSPPISGGLVYVWPRFEAAVFWVGGQTVGTQLEEAHPGPPPTLGPRVIPSARAGGSGPVGKSSCKDPPALQGPRTPLCALHWGTDIFRQSALYCVNSASTVLVGGWGGRVCQQPHLVPGAWAASELQRLADWTRAPRSDGSWPSADSREVFLSSSLSPRATSL